MRSQTMNTRASSTQYGCTSQYDKNCTKMLTSILTNNGKTLKTNDVKTSDLSDDGMYVLKHSDWEWNIEEMSSPDCTAIKDDKRMVNRRN